MDVIDRIQQGALGGVPVAVTAAVLAFLLAASASDVALSQTPADQLIIQQETDRLQREEQLRRQDFLEDQDVRRRPPTAVSVPAPDLGPDQAPGRCFQVDVIDVRNARFFTRPDQNVLLAPYLGKCIGLADIQSILRQITAFYIDEGLVTSRAYVPEQDLGDGTLEIEVVEGRLEAIEPENRSTGVNFYTAFPHLTGEVLNIRDIEQGLEQINRLRSNDARMLLYPGTKPGYSRIVVKNDPGFRIGVVSSMDNYGSETSGRYKADGSLFLENLLGLNEQIILGYGRNLDEPNRLSLSESMSVLASIPYGYWTLSGGYSKFDYRALIAGQVQSFKSDGTGDTYSVNLSYVLQRGRTSKTTVTAGFVRKNNKNFIEDSKLVTSSRVLSIADISIVSSFYGLGGSWTLDAGVSQGLPILGTAGNPEAPGLPEIEFTRFHGGVTYSTGTRIGPIVAGIITSASAQYSEDFLPSTEQFSLGGVYTVRGFQDQSISGDQGVLIRNEFYTALPATGMAFIDDVLGTLRPYIALDAGHIFRHLLQEGGTMAGAAVGLKAVGGILSFDLAYAMPLKHPDLISNPDNAIYFRAGVAF